MLEDYCSRLQDLNKQKNSFLKLKHKTNTKAVLQKQQNKYHKYILSQISYKNRLDSLFKINEVIGNAIRKQKKPIFYIFFKTTTLTIKENNIYNLLRQKRQENSECMQIQPQRKVNKETKQFKTNLQKISCNLLSRWVHNQQQKSLKSSFKKALINKQRTENFQRIFSFIEGKIKFQQNVFFLNIKTYKKSCGKKLQFQNRQSKSFIFSLNQLSQIIPSTIQQQSQENSSPRIKNIQYIDSNFKSASLSSYQVIQIEQSEYNLMLTSLQKLKDQVLIMRNVLCQKNRQIKQKDEQIFLIKKQYQNKIQALHDQFSDKIQDQQRQEESIKSKYMGKSNNQKMSLQYLKQLQDHIIGDRTPRINQQEQDTVSQQLVQKYMKQSFQIREKMDMARQMCQQFEFDSRTQEGKIMIEITKLLTPDERLNAQLD